MANAWLSAENGDKGGGKRETRWLTPKSLVNALGVFDLDPCGAPGHALASRTYLPEDGEDGLSLPWNGRVWLNPPYNRLEAAAFLKKLRDHGNGVALIFARTETALFHEVVWGSANSLLFLKGRVTFLDSSGTAASANAGAPSVLVAFGDENTEALRSTSLPGAFVNLIGGN